jgi:hypothetical protein
MWGLFADLWYLLELLNRSGWARECTSDLYRIGVMLVAIEAGCIRLAKTLLKELIGTIDGVEQGEADVPP